MSEGHDVDMGEEQGDDEVDEEEAIAHEARSRRAEETVAGCGSFFPQGVTHATICFPSIILAFDLAWGSEDQ